MTENEIGKWIVDRAVQIHREIGPGLLETVYEVILASQLRQRGIQVERQVAVPIEYRGRKFNEGFRVDLVIENKVIVETKCVEKLNNVHKKQLLTYLRLAGSMTRSPIKYCVPRIRRALSIDFSNKNK